MDREELIRLAEYLEGGMREYQTGGVDPGLGFNLGAMYRNIRSRFPEKGEGIFAQSGNFMRSLPYRFGDGDTGEGVPIGEPEGTAGLGDRMRFMFAKKDKGVDYSSESPRELDPWFYDNQGGVLSSKEDIKKQLSERYNAGELSPSEYVEAYTNLENMPEGSLGNLSSTLTKSAPGQEGGMGEFSRVFGSVSSINPMGYSMSDDIRRSGAFFGDGDKGKGFASLGLGVLEGTRNFLTGFGASRRWREAEDWRKEKMKQNQYTPVSQSQYGTTGDIGNAEYGGLFGYTHGGSHEEIEEPTQEQLNRGSAHVMGRLARYHESKGKWAPGDVYDEMFYEGHVPRKYADKHLSRLNVSIPYDMHGMQEFLNKHADEALGYDPVSLLPLQDNSSAPYNPDAQNYRLMKERIDDYVEPSEFSDEGGVNMVDGLSEEERHDMESIRSWNSRRYEYGGLFGYPDGGEVPAGYHRMPDGSIMADSEHERKKPSPEQLAWRLREKRRSILDTPTSPNYLQEDKLSDVRVLDDALRKMDLKPWPKERYEAEKQGSQSNTASFSDGGGMGAPGGQMPDIKNDPRFQPGEYIEFEYGGKTHKGVIKSNDGESIELE